MRESGLADARNVLDQQVAARQQTGEAQPNLRVLAEDDAVDLSEHRAQAARDWPLAACRPASWSCGAQRADARDLRGQLIGFGA